MNHYVIMSDVRWALYSSEVHSVTGSTVQESLANANVKRATAVHVGP